jgi:hypothetical protein
MSAGVPVSSVTRATNELAVTELIVTKYAVLDGAFAVATMAGEVLKGLAVNVTPYTPELATCPIVKAIVDDCTEALALIKAPPTCIVLLILAVALTEVLLSISTFVPGRFTSATICVPVIPPGATIRSPPLISIVLLSG